MIWRIPHPFKTLLFRNNSKQCLDGQVSYLRIVLHAEVAKLADALASGASSRKGVEVQVLSSAFKLQVTSQVFKNFQAYAKLEGLLHV